MTPSEAVVLGTLDPDGSLRLDVHPGLPPGRVEVRLHLVIDAPPASPEGLMAVLEGVWADQERTGHVPRTYEEIDAEVAASRADWDHRDRGIDLLHELASRGGSSEGGSRE